MKKKKSKKKIIIGTAAVLVVAGGVTVAGQRDSKETRFIFHFPAAPKSDRLR